MKEIFSEKIVVKENLERVWEYFIKFDENGAKWMPGISDMRVTGPELKKGSEIISLSRGKEITSTVTEYQKFNCVTLTSNQGNFRADYTYTFTKNDGYTEVELNAKIEAIGISKVFIPLLKGIIKKTDGGQLQKLKADIEVPSKTNKG